MGVMSCSRTGCGNIMCDTYVDGIGYVCNECQSEFKDHMKICPSTESAIREELQFFMATRKDSYRNSGEMDVNEFFRQYTRE